MDCRFPLTRDAALARLTDFVPLAGRAYAARRNHDGGPDGRATTSLLSPAIRRRLISEQEVAFGVEVLDRLIPTVWPELCAPAAGA